jgi:hypothetical protein
VSSDENSFSFEFRFSQFLVEPVKMMVRVCEVDEQPEVQVIAEVRVHRYHAKARSHQGLKILMFLRNS